MNFESEQNIDLGISEKKDGPMKNQPKNRTLFFKNKKLNKKIIISAGLVHGNKVAIIDDINQNEVIFDCDALITNRDKYLLTVTVSDCLPIYFYDRNKKIIAIAHAGWRGVVSEIVKEVINKFVGNYSSDLSDIEVFIGPHICDCHFEVEANVASFFAPLDSIIREKKIYINLSQAVKNQLLKCGLSDANLNISEECTYCADNKYFSFRRDKPESVEAMVAYIGLK